LGSKKREDILVGMTWWKEVVGRPTYPKKKAKEYVANSVGRFTITLEATIEIPMCSL
jgi:hypothetical protein